MQMSGLSHTSGSSKSLDQTHVCECSFATTVVIRSCTGCGITLQDLPDTRDKTSLDSGTASGAKRHCIRLGILSYLIADLT
jgi:hypothetical protein